MTPPGRSTGNRVFCKAGLIASCCRRRDAVIVSCYWRRDAVIVCCYHNAKLLLRAAVNDAMLLLWAAIDDAMLLLWAAITTRCCYCELLSTTRCCYCELLSTTRCCYCELLSTTRCCYCELLSTTRCCYFELLGADVHDTYMSRYDDQVSFHDKGWWGHGKVSSPSYRTWNLALGRFCSPVWWLCLENKNQYKSLTWHYMYLDSWQNSWLFSIITITIHVLFKG